MRLALLAATTLIALSRVALADDASRKTFEDRVFEPTVIKAFGIDPGRYASLNSSSRADVISARKTVELLLKACHRGTIDPRIYLSAALKKTYPTGDAVKKAFFDPETIVVLFFVTDFKLESEESIGFSISLVLFSEGNILAQDHNATVKLESGGWKVSSFGGLLLEH